MNESKQRDEVLLPQTTYKNKRVASDDERFRLNTELNTYLFNNCDHERDDYHPTCRPCVLDCLAVIASRASVAAVEGDAQAKRNDYNMTAWRERFARISVEVPYSDEWPLRDTIKDADTVIRLLYKEVQSLRAAASSPLPAEPHYFVPTETCDTCGYEGCDLDVLAHPETPKHNFPEGEQEFSLLSVLKAAANYIILPEQMEQLAPGAREAITKGLLWAIRERENPATPPPALPSDAAMRAAEEISSTFGLKFQHDSLHRTAAIITRHLPAPSTAIRDEEKVYKAALETISESDCKGECPRIAILALSYPPDIVGVAVGGEALTRLQRAVIEHDDDMARLDRSTFPAEVPPTDAPCSAIAPNPTYEQLLAWHGTEQSMHAAWRKRAEEAEKSLAVHQRVVKILAGGMNTLCAGCEALFGTRHGEQCFIAPLLQSNVPAAAPVPAAGDGEEEDEPTWIPCCSCGKPTTRDEIYGDLCWRCCRADNE